MKIKEIFNKYKQQFIIAGGIIIILAIIVIGFVAIKAGNNDKTSTETKETQTVESEEETVLEEDPQPQVLEEETGVEVEAENLLAGNNDFEVSGLTYGIDVSKWQGKIDWAAVKASGIEYAMVRVGYRTEGNGTICEDAYAKYNMQNASNAGIKVGVYFFSTAISTEEAKEEAEWVANYIAKYRITYPVVYNCEGFTQSDSRMNQLTNTQRTNNAITFLDYIDNKGYTPMLYASSSELAGSTSWDTSKIAQKYKIWVAQYSGTAFTTGSKSSYSGVHAMWQHTNKGIVNGINGYVDMNIAYFGYSVEAEPKDASGVENATVPVQSTTAYDPYQAASDQVTAKIETNLRTAANGNDASNIVYLLKNGEFLTRTAIGTNGWSKVTYNGQTLYAKTSYLTTSTEPPTTEAVTEPPTTAFDPFADKNFSTVSESVTAKEETALRTVPNTKGNEPVYMLKKGEYITRTGIDTNTNWSRVDYNGQTLYAVSSLLTTE